MSLFFSIYFHRPSSFYFPFPSLLPSPLLFLFSYGEKRVAADNPLLPCLILIAFTGSRLDQYTPTVAFHRCCRASTLSLSLSLSTDLNYPKGCFDEGFSIFSFHPLLPSPRPSPVYRRETLHILGPLAPNLLVHLVLAQSDLSRAPDTFSYIFFPFFFLEIYLSKPFRGKIIIIMEIYGVLFIYFFFFRVFFQVSKG